MPFIRAENAVGARSAQVWLRHATAFMTLYIITRVLKGL